MKRILIVDDNETNRKYLSTVLSDYQTSEAISGEEAIEYCNAQETDLILLDIQMPKMDGFECMKRLRGTGYKNPILAITAFSGAEEKERFLSAGFDDYIVKPVEAAKLRAHVSIWCKEDHPPLFIQDAQDNAKKDYDVATKEDLLRFISQEEYDQLVEQFIIELKNYCTDVDNLSLDSDMSELIRIFHTIKGNAGSLGFDRLSKLAATLEADLKNEYYPEFSNNFATFKNYLETFLINF